MIVVESPEHARKLQRLLPKWQVLDMMSGKPSPNSDLPRRIIATTSYVAAKGIRAQVWIRATGTPWPLRLKNFPPRSDTGYKGAVLLVDIQDQMDAQATDDTERRIQEYQRRFHRVRLVKP